MKSPAIRIRANDDASKSHFKIAASGFKHTATMLLAAAPLLSSPLQLENFPRITDVLGMANCLEYLGCEINLQANRLVIDSRNLNVATLPARLTRKLHGPLYFLPSLGSRLRSFQMGSLGGCRIGNPVASGERPTTHVLEVIRRFGISAEVLPDGGFRLDSSNLDFAGATIDVQEWSDDPKRLRGPMVSGVTKTAILAGLGVKSGVTTILNPDLRLETLGLINVCKQAGWSIDQNAGYLCIGPRPERLTHLAPVAIPSDLIEIITYITLAVCVNRPAEITISAADDIERDLSAELDLLRYMGIKINRTGTQLEIVPSPPHRRFDVCAGPSGIYSDSQPFFALMANYCDGTSIVKDEVWKNRFNFLTGLRLFGMHISHDEINGSLAISPAPMNTDTLVLDGHDLRSTAVLAIAASSRKGVTLIRNAGVLERGYEGMLGKLRRIGVEVDTVDDGVANDLL